MADNDYKGIVIRLTEEATKHVRSSKRIMIVINRYARLETEYNSNDDYDTYSDEDVFKHFDDVLKNMSKELCPLIIEEIIESGEMKIEALLLVDWFEVMIKILLEQKQVEDILHILRNIADELSDEYDASDYE